MGGRNLAGIRFVTPLCTSARVASAVSICASIRPTHRSEVLQQLRESSESRKQVLQQLRFPSSVNQAEAVFGNNAYGKTETHAAPSFKCFVELLLMLDSRYHARVGRVGVSV